MDWSRQVACIRKKMRLRRIRTRLYGGQGGKCIYCGASMILPGKHMRIELPNMATLEHVIPVSRGGRKHHTDNMVVACKACNSAKGDAFPGRIITDEPVEPAPDSLEEM